MKPRKIALKVLGWFRCDVDVDFLESYRKLLFGQYVTLSLPINNPEAKGGSGSNNQNES